jgi:hypothetical protein
VLGETKRLRPVEGSAIPGSRAGHYVTVSCHLGILFQYPLFVLLQPRLLAELVTATKRTAVKTQTAPEVEAQLHGTVEECLTWLALFNRCACDVSGTCNDLPQHTAHLQFAVLTGSLLQRRRMPDLLDIHIHTLISGCRLRTLASELQVDARVSSLSAPQQHTSSKAGTFATYLLSLIQRLRSPLLFMATHAINFLALSKQVCAGLPPSSQLACWPPVHDCFDACTLHSHSTALDCLQASMCPLTKPAPVLAQDIVSLLSSRPLLDDMALRNMDFEQCAHMCEIYGLMLRRVLPSGTVQLGATHQQGRSGPDTAPPASLLGVLVDTSRPNVCCPQRYHTSYTCCFYKLCLVPSPGAHAGCTCCSSCISILPSSSSTFLILKCC